MADIALSTKNASTQAGNSSASIPVEESFEQMTLPAHTDLNEGTPVFVNSANKFQMSDASGAGTAKFYGITVRKVKANEAVTAIARGVVGGFTLGNSGTEVFLSDTDGRLADAAGTVSRKVGEVIPAYGQPRGAAVNKLLRITG